MSDNDRSGRCVHCGRDNRGFEHLPCSDDCPGESTPPNAEDQANAHLIATTPDLLEALEECAEYIAMTWEDDIENAPNCYRAALHAILKAKGELTP